MAEESEKIESLRDRKRANVLERWWKEHNDYKVSEDDFRRTFLLVHGYKPVRPAGDSLARIVAGLCHLLSAVCFALALVLIVAIIGMSLMVIEIGGSEFVEMVVRLVEYKKMQQ